MTIPDSRRQSRLVKLLWTFRLGNTMIYDVFVNCNWVVTRWQYTFTHKKIGYIEQHK